MCRKRLILFRLDILLLLINATPDLILGLKDVSVTVPTAVKKGENALLICNYDMENDILYSVKWYKGRREFYRYTPKENPAMKTFTASGINVERALSNQSHVVLTSIQLNNSGKFSCEVSADAPSFHTVIVSGDMEVVEIPEQKPSLTGVHSRYRIGDTIIGNCTSYNSKPAANLTWTINDIPALPHQTKYYPIVKNPIDYLEISVAELNLLISPQHFIRGRLKLKCIARIHGIYEQETEKIVDEDRPRILASGRSPDVSLFPYDQQQSDAESNEQNELYLTHYKDIASSASAISTSSSTILLSSYILHLHNECNRIGRKILHKIIYSTTTAVTITARARVTAATTEKLYDILLFIRRFLRRHQVIILFFIIIMIIKFCLYHHYEFYKNSNNTRNKTTTNNEFISLLLLLLFKINFNQNNNNIDDANNNNLLKSNNNKNENENNEIIKLIKSQYHHHNSYSYANNLSNEQNFKYSISNPNATTTITFPLIPITITTTTTTTTKTTTNNLNNNLKNIILCMTKSRMAMMMMVVVVLVVVVVVVLVMLGLLHDTSNKNENKKNIKNLMLINYYNYYKNIKTYSISYTDSFQLINNNYKKFIINNNNHNNTINILSNYYYYYYYNKMINNYVYYYISSENNHNKNFNNIKFIINYLLYENHCNTCDNNNNIDNIDNDYYSNVVDNNNNNYEKIFKIKFSS